MTQLKLKRVLRKNKPSHKVMRDLVNLLGVPITIRDVDGTLLLGQSPEQGLNEVTIEDEGSILGWVYGPQEQSILVAQLLQTLVFKEVEKRALANEVLDKYRELNLLYNLSERLISSPEPGTIAMMALEEATRLISATAGWVIVSDESSKDQKIIGNAGAPLILNQKASGSDDLVAKVLAGREAEIRNDVAAHKLFQGGRFEKYALACAPLKTEQRVLGVMLLAGLQPITYEAHHLKLLNTVALQAGPAIEMARLYQVAIEKGRMERELQLGYQVQASLIPKKIPKLERWEFSGRWRPARELSGDYYDFIYEENDHLGLVIGDVADKGLPSALFMVFTRSAVRTAVVQTTSPAEAIYQANRLVEGESTNGLFVTLMYARLIWQSGLLTYVNAGHNPALHYHKQTDRLTELKLTGLPLGIIDKTPYEQRQVQIEPGDFIVFYTDGVTEAMSETNEEFGMERLVGVIRSSVDLPAEEIAVAIESAVRDFTGTAPAFDDFTLMILRRSP